MMHLVQLDQVDNVWPRVKGWIAEAIAKARSNRSMLQTYAMCRNGSYWLAVNTVEKEGGLDLGDIRGVAVLDFTEVDGETALHHVIVAGEGDTEEWFQELIHWDWLTEMGVQVVVTEGRAGWARRLGQLIPDLKVIRVVMTWRHDGGDR